MAVSTTVLVPIGSFCFVLVFMTFFPSWLVAIRFVPWPHASVRCGAIRAIALDVPMLGGIGEKSDNSAIRRDRLGAEDALP
jgi:hypothetical protein